MSDLVEEAKKLSKELDLHIGHAWQKILTELIAKVESLTKEVNALTKQCDDWQEGHISLTKERDEANKMLVDSAKLNASAKVLELESENAELVSKNIKNLEEKLELKKQPSVFQLRIYRESQEYPRHPPGRWLLLPDPATGRLPP